MPTAPEILPTAASSIARARRARARRIASCSTSSFRPKVVGSAWIPWRAPDARRGLVFERAAPQRGERRVAIGEQQVAGGADLERERGVDHVARRHAVVDEARVGTDVLGDAGGERDHVVLHLALDLGDARDVEARALADRRERRRGNHAALGEHFAGGEFHAQPVPVARLVGP